MINPTPPRLTERHEATVERVLFDEVVDTDYGQFDLGWGDGYGFDGDFDRFFAGQINGLVGAGMKAGLYLNLARRSGGSHVRVVSSDSEPTLDAEWEDVVEVSVTIPAGAASSWSTWSGEESGALALQPGTYRVRVSARGRDAGRAGEFDEGVVDFYLVEFWPAPVQPDAVVRTGSDDAAYWHREVGGRR
ncbi:hypothetical protein AB3X52_00860 [Nocardioides sp. DS6]|uniref:DUF4265 domain-containing protein n=1 Tax=Nocardioides eburneus TaxID=3231482 RepID=A0ABV3STA0_9ACTN